MRREKLDARTRRLLDTQAEAVPGERDGGTHGPDQAGQAGEEARPADQRELGVMLRGAGPFSQEQLDQLASCGLRVRSVAGDVCSATASGTSAIEAVTELDFVVAVQASAPLFPEEEAEPGR